MCVTAYRGGAQMLRFRCGSGCVCDLFIPAVSIEDGYDRADTGVLWVQKTNQSASISDGCAMPGRTSVYTLCGVVESVAEVSFDECCSGREEGALSHRSSMRAIRPK